jgi:hypothetical protein
MLQCSRLKQVLDKCLVLQAKQDINAFDFGEFIGIFEISK